MSFPSKLIAVLAVSAALSPAASAASPLKFRFTNPAFGGSPLNASFFLNMAENQKQFKEKEEDQSFNEKLKEQIESRLLTAVATKIADAVGGAPNGVTVINEDGIIIIIDKNGNETKIDIVQIPTVGDIDISGLN
jgi:curli production assembly/transport component CsgF